MDVSVVSPADINPSQLMHVVAAFLEQQAIRYRVVGSLASMAYGEPRFTNDIDFLADIRLEHAAAFLQAFPPPEHYLSEAAMRAAIQQPGQFNIIHIPSGLWVDMIVLGQDGYAQVEIQSGRRLTSPGECDVWCAAPEDVILNTLLYYREGGSDKHLRDIASMLMIQGAAIDRGYIASWAVQLGVLAEWKALLADLAE